MIDFYRLYLPLSKREVKIQVSVPRNKDDIVFDTFYFLDGQNAFSDATSAFGRSIRATKHLGAMSKHLGKRILGVAIYNRGTDRGRVNEYSPWLIDNPLEENWVDNDTRVFDKFYKDFISTIIPFIEKKYHVTKDRYIYGSSLGAVTAAYMCFNDDTFKGCGLFSLSHFLFEKAFYEFTNSKLDIMKKKKVFLYVGKEEFSDSMETKDIYITTVKRFNDYLNENKIPTRLVVSFSGEHNEETWDHNFLDFLNFMYYDNIIYKY